MKDFNKVDKYDPDWCHREDGYNSVEVYMALCEQGDWVKYIDYHTLLKAYNELKWMYEGLSK